MQRRTWILTFGSLAAVPVLGYGQSTRKMVRIGILAGDLTAPHEEEELLNGLREQGLIEGANSVIQ